MQSKITVQQKLSSLSEQGYQLIGDIPTFTEFTSLQSGFGAFLFRRNGDYYQYQIRKLFSEKEVQLNEFNDPPPSPRPNNVASSPFIKITGSSKPEENKGFIYVAIQESNLDDSQPPKNILLVKYDASLTYHATLAGNPYYLPPPFFYINSSYENLDREQFAAQLQKIKCYPKAAYILLDDTFIYVKQVDDKMCWEPLNFKPGTSIDPLKKQFNKDVPKGVIESTPEILEANISDSTFQFIKENALDHNPIIHKIIGGEMYFVSEGKEEINTAQDKMKLINNKSGSFRTNDEEATRILSKMFTTQDLEKAYVKNNISVEKVQLELSKRLQSSPEGSNSVSLLESKDKSVSTKINSSSSLPTPSNQENSESPGVLSASALPISNTPNFFGRDKHSQSLNSPTRTTKRERSNTF